MLWKVKYLKTVILAVPKAPLPMVIIRMTPVRTSKKIRILVINDAINNLLFFIISHHAS